MNNNKIQSLCASTIIYHVLRASAVGISFSNIVVTAKQNSYLSVILGFVLGFIPILLFFYIMNYDKDLSMIEIIEKIFGKVLGKIINSILILFIFLFATITLWNLSDFITSQFLPNIPTSVIMVMFLIPTIYILFKGLVVIARTSLMLFYINIIVFIFIVLSLGPQVNPTNMLPFLEDGIMPIFKGSYEYIAYNVLPLFLLTIIPKNKILPEKKFKKQTFIMYILSFIAILSVITLVIGISGINLSLLFSYPEYNILKRISLFSTIERIEAMLSLTWLFALFITISLSIHYICKTISLTANIKNKKMNSILIIIISILVLFSAQMIFKNHTEAVNFLLHIFPPIIYTVFLIIPIIISIRIFYLKRIRKA